MNNRVLLLLSKGVSYIGTKLFSFALFQCRKRPYSEVRAFPTLEQSCSHLL